MAASRFVIPSSQAPSHSAPTNVGQVDPNSMRSMLMLESVSHMMTETDWPYRAASIELTSQGDEVGAYRLFGANNPNSIWDVFERKIDISIMNPSAILRMADRGVGLFSEPMQVALIAVMPHYDQLGFAVSNSSGLTSLTGIREKRYPLRLSVRGSLDACTTILVDQVLKSHGFSYEDILSWGGSVSYDQSIPSESSPNQLSRIERVANGELDAIFEEAVMAWANDAVDAGMKFLDIDEDHLVILEQEGFTRGTMEKSRLTRLPVDVATVDFCGWPIYTRVDASDLLIRKFCEALEARKDTIPWTWGPVKQKPMPLERMVRNAPDTPIDVAFHPAARECWTKLGYLK